MNTTVEYGIKIWCKQGFISSKKFNQVFTVMKQIARNRPLQVLLFLYI